ncbi:MAG: hypothetical protein ABSA16_08130 [Thermoguttaceae bacterium]
MPCWYPCLLLWHKTWDLVALVEAVVLVEVVGIWVLWVEWDQCTAWVEAWVAV